MGSYSKRQTEVGWAEGWTVWRISSNWIQYVDLWCYLSLNPKLFCNSQGQVERNATQEIVKGDWKLFFDKLIKIKLASFFWSLLLSQGTGCLFLCTFWVLSKYLLIISRFQLFSWRWVLQSFSFLPFLSLQFSFQFCLGCSYGKLVIMEQQSGMKK